MKGGSRVFSSSNIQVLKGADTSYSAENLSVVQIEKSDDMKIFTLKIK